MMRLLCPLAPSAAVSPCPDAAAAAAAAADAHADANADADADAFSSLHKPFSLVNRQIIFI